MIEHETLLRLGVFLGIFLLMAILETRFPKRSRTQRRTERWGTNLGLVLVDSIALKIALPLFALGTAAIADERSWGLLNLLQLPFWLELIIAVVLLDMMIYWQHVASHKIPILWRLHRIHHADRDIDVTTGVRFHPAEIILSMLYKMIIVLLLGPSIVAVMIFEILLNACAMFNHANLRLPSKLDNLLRLLIVTPDMHRVHHSTLTGETNSNYGFFLSFWDRLFGSYIAQPRDGHQQMRIGLSDCLLYTSDAADD